MKPFTHEELFRAKAERRARLAALPLVEKVRLIEKLRDTGETLRAARMKMSAVK